MLPAAVDVLTHAGMITGFVFVMMVVIEYLNVLTAGAWQHGLRGNRWRQYLLAAALGATPGCLGAFAVAALYSHRVVTLGAVVAAMIATSGDEAFVMLGMVPGTALIVFAALFGVGIAAGVLTDLVFGGKSAPVAAGGHGLDLHEAEECQCYARGWIADQWRHCTLARGVLSLALALFLFGLLTGQVGPPHLDLDPDDAAPDHGCGSLHRNDGPEPLPGRTPLGSRGQGACTPGVPVDAGRSGRHARAGHSSAPGRLAP